MILTNFVTFSRSVSSSLPVWVRSVVVFCDNVTIVRSVPPMSVPGNSSITPEIYITRAVYRINLYL
jgi:hypothetical protein